MVFLWQNSFLRKTHMMRLNFLLNLRILKKNNKKNWKNHLMELRNFKVKMKKSKNLKQKSKVNFLKNSKMSKILGKSKNLKNSKNNGKKKFKRLKNQRKLHRKRRQKWRNQRKKVKEWTFHCMINYCQLFPKWRTKKIGKFVKKVVLSSKNYLRKLICGSKIMASQTSSVSLKKDSVKRTKLFKSSLFNYLAYWL